MSWILQELLLSHCGWEVSLGQASLIILLYAFVDGDHVLALYLNYVANATFELYFASTTIYQTWFVITLFRTLMMKLYLWTFCNMWHVCWIMYDLGCMWIVYRDPLWYSTDYQVYMGSSMTVRLLVGCHCTCALINWSVLRQPASEQDSTLIATCVFKHKGFCFPEPVSRN